jgi:hypothetical protein
LWTGSAHQTYPQTNDPTAKKIHKRCNRMTAFVKTAIIATRDKNTNEDSGRGRLVEQILV